MRRQPKSAGAEHGIDTSLNPPCGFVAAAMDLAMVASTQGNSEFIADLASKRLQLREAEMVSVRGLAATNQAGLLSDKDGVIGRQLVDS